MPNRYQERDISGSQGVSEEKPTCAKVLFIITFVNVPILVADSLIVHAAGFPITANIGALLWTQVLLLAVFEIPAAAVSSITSGLLELLMATLFLILAGLVCLLVAPLTHFGFSWTGLEWVRNYYLFGQVTIGATIILFCQYAYRATFATRIAAVFGPILIFASTVLLSWTTGFQVQMYFSKRAVDIPSVRIQLDSERKWAGSVYFDDHQDAIANIPIQVDGLPTGAELKPLGVRMKLLDPDGQTWELKAPPPESFECDSGAMSLRLVMPKAMYEQLRRKPLHVHGTLYFSLYEKDPSVSLPLGSHRTYIDGVGLCAATTQLLLCSWAFRHPPGSVDLELTQQSPKGPVRIREQLSRLGSSSPFPADFNVDPVFQLYSPRLAPISDVLIKPSEPIAFSNKSFSIDHLVLADFVFRK